MGFGKNVTCIICGIGIIAFPQFVLGEKVKVIRLEEIVVTAAKIKTPIKESPASVTVITGEDIKRENIQNLDQAMRHVTGAWARRGKGYMDVLSQVTLRGFPDPKRTLILIDGQPLNEAYGGVVDWTSLPIEEIERIEAAKGPFSSLYGGNAMGGVINIITKTPKKLVATADLIYGSHNSFNRRFYFGNRFFNRLSLSMGYEEKDTNGYVTDFKVIKPTRPGEGVEVRGGKWITDEKGNPAYLVGDKGKNWLRDYSAYTKFSFDLLKGHSLSFAFNEGKYEYGYEPGRSYLKDAFGNVVDSGYVVVDGKRFKLSPYYFLGGSGERITDVYRLGYKGEIRDFLTLKLNFGLTDNRKYWYTFPKYGATKEGGPGELNDTPSKGWHFEAAGDLSLTDYWLLTLGFDWRRERAKSEKWRLSDWRNETKRERYLYACEGKDRLTSFYFQNKWLLPFNFTLFFGGRYDYWKTFDGWLEDIEKGVKERYKDRSADKFCPKASLVFSPIEQLSSRISVGRAFRTPNIYELYKTWWFYGKEYRGNPDLGPEETVSWDIGMDLNLFKKNTIFRISYFENYISDLIYRAYKGKENGVEVYIWENAGKAQIKGIELELEQKIGPYLTLFGNYTNLVTMKITENPAYPASVNKRITYFPKITASVGLSAHYKRFKGTLSYDYVGKVFKRPDNSDIAKNVPGVFDPYGILNMKLSFEVTKFIEAAFSIDNLTGRSYYQSYKAPDTMYFGQIKLKY